MKYNILIVDAFQGAGGEEEIAFYIYKNINRNKYNVFLAGPDNSPYFKKNKPDKDEWFTCSMMGKSNFKSMSALRCFIREHNIDLIHVHGYSAGYLVRVACVGMKNVKVVWTMHLNICDVVTMRKLNRSISTIVENILNRNRLFSDQIICVSEDSRKQLKKRGVELVPIEVIYNGIDIPKFINTIKAYKTDGRLTLGFISRLSVQKDLPTLMMSFNRIVELGMDVNLVIAGEGEMESYVREFIVKKNLGDRIEMLGFQSNIPEILSKVDVVMLPSLFECFPIIILEALCSGTPVIASNVNGIPEVITDSQNGFLVEPGDVDEIVRKVSKYYNNRKLIEMHGLEGKKLIMSNFSKEKMLIEHERIYQKVLLS